jgi:hypothetical protein
MLNSGLIGWMPTSLLYDPSGGKGWDGTGVIPQLWPFISYMAYYMIMENISILSILSILLWLISTISIIPLSHYPII